MDVQEVEQEAPLAVKSLRSRFEHLAVASGRRLKHAPSVAASESSKAGAFPRPRSSSNNTLGIYETSIQLLRATASSSDLKTADLVDTKTVALKRPPPPPPPSRTSRPSASPHPSPLARIAPLPPSTPVNGSTNWGSEPESPPRDIAALREKFNDKGSIRKSFPPDAPASSKPPVPPRPSFVVSRSPDEEAEVLLLESQRVASPEPGTAPTERASMLSRRAPPSPKFRSKITAEDTDTTQDSDASSSLAPNAPSPPPPPPRASRLSGLPLPPPRHRTSVSPHPPSVETMAGPPLATLPPPPLPIRRGTIPYPISDSTQMRQSPPKRTKLGSVSPLSPDMHLNGHDTFSDSAPSPVERRFVGTSRLPPPPTRTIALGDKLPAPRRAEISSDDEEALDEEPTRVLDALPDTSGSSRRVPALSFRDGAPTPKLTFHPHSGCVIASGPYIVVAHVHHLKIYNLEVSDAPLFDLEMKQLGVKEAKILSMEFRPCANRADRGCLVWLGTKDGSILEMDIRVGLITHVKPAAHLHPVLHIFRHGRSMVTLDESGKVLVFSPDPEHPDMDVSLLQTVPRTVRTTDKHDFVKLLDGKLWTASRNEHQASGSVMSRPLPIIRVFDIFNPAIPGKSILPSGHVGQVTAATILPAQQDKVFVGHEEGYVSMWALDTADGWPVCVEVTKVSTSDIVSLEGVHERLWIGSRNGMISAYEVSQRPWTMTNSWNAHPSLPVLKIFVNFRAIETNRKLCVVSLGRDEIIKLWDGLLGVDWVENELVKNESSFSTFQDVSALVFSWNCDAARPDSLLDDKRNAELFNDVLSSVPTPPDIISFSFQEVIDLESRKMAAKNMILGGKKKDDALSDRVTGAYKRWHDRLVAAVKTAFLPLGVEYTAVNTESMVGLFSCLFLKTSKDFLCREKNIAAIKRGMGGRYGNKGAVIARVVIGDSSLCFINCHLAAGQHALKQRNADVAAILEEKGVFEPSPLEAAYVGGGDGTMVLDHEFVLLNGDLNYRIDLTRRETYLSAFRSGDLSNLLSHDQLLQQMKLNKTFRLRGFSEGAITFLPTYKYDPRSDEYDTSEKRRHPAWCDRILWRSRVPNRVQQLHYQRYEVNVSDHRPISAAFVIKVKNIQPEARQRSKAIVEAAWADEQVRILDAAQKFYVRQALL